MKKTQSQYAKKLINILNQTPLGSQWVVFTPTFSVASLIENDDSTANLKFDILSGAHTHLFESSLNRFKSKQSDGLIISFEQTLNFSKFNQIKQSIKNADTIIVDAAYRLDLENIHYSIELEVFINQIKDINPRVIHTLQGSIEPFVKNAHHHEIDLPNKIEKWPFNLSQMLDSIKSKRTLWIAQSWSEANIISAVLHNHSIKHALVHKKVEESAKVLMEKQFIEHDLNVCVLTWETQLPLEVQGVECVVFTFEILSDTMIRFFLPYVINDAHWKTISWFKTLPMSHFTLPVNQNMFDFIHHVQMIENGCSMREAERSLNIDSYEFEKIIKFLKGRSIIKKEGLNYVIDDIKSLAAIESIEFELHSSLSVKIENISGSEDDIPTGVFFPFSPKKIMPVGWYDFAIIPEHLKHVDGVICVSGINIDVIKQWCLDQNIDTILMGSHHLNQFSGLLDSFRVEILTFNQAELLGGNNPYQKVMRAKKVIDQWKIPSLTQDRKTAIILDHYDEGWSVSALSIALKTHAPHLDLFPICIAF
jgi:hypothetical protein